MLSGRNKFQPKSNTVLKYSRQELFNLRENSLSAQCPKVIPDLVKKENFVSPTPTKKISYNKLDLLRLRASPKSAGCNLLQQIPREINVMIPARLRTDEPSYDHGIDVNGTWFVDGVEMEYNYDPEAEEGTPGFGHETGALEDLHNERVDRIRLRLERAIQPLPTEEARHQLLTNHLYSIISKFEPKLASEIASMISESFDTDELMEHSVDMSKLRPRINQALSILRPE